MSGTMAHAFIQSFENEIIAFRKFSEGRPENCVLLVDTYNTLESGVPNAIAVAKEMEHRGQRLSGIRLDSGDLAYLSKASRQMLDEAGLSYVKIAVSNQLDEFVIKSLLEQQAPIDIFGVGTNLVTGHPDGALDGVYKLACSDGKPRIKLSETLKKTTLPDKKQVFRVYDKNGLFFGADAIGLNNEERVDHIYDPFEPHKSLSLKGTRQEPLLAMVMEKGKMTMESKSLEEIASYSKGRLKLLPDEFKRFQNPHTYKIGISKSLMTMRDDLRDKFLNK
jgi:nicotinate phosphoribosyltransferase